MAEQQAASRIYPYLFGNVALGDWIEKASDQDEEPWRSFARSAELLREGHRNDAIALWRQVAEAADVESRQTLQAWHFLRQAGVEPPANIAKRVLGVIVEMPMDSGHDTLAAYEDGSARYLNFSGKIVVWEDRTVPEVQEEIRDWLAAGQELAGTIGPWDKPDLPDLPTGHARVLMLTSSGPHFGQAPVDALLADPTAQRFFASAMSLMRLLTSKAEGNQSPG